MPALHAHSFGPAGGAPVLVVHGVTNTGARYRRLAEDELPGCRVVAPDLRGHGASTWDPPWDVGRHVADLIALLDAERIARATVVAHSFGGMVALELAAAAPDRVEGLALLDPACGIDPARALREAEDARRDEGWASVEEARSARRALRPPHARDTVDEDLATFLGRDDDGRYRLRYCRSAIVAAWSEMARPVPSLAPYSGPVLLVTALRSDYVTEALVAGLRRDAGARLTERGIDAGHMLAWDAREELGALLREWMAP